MQHPRDTCRKDHSWAGPVETGCGCGSFHVVQSFFHVSGRNQARQNEVVKRSIERHDARKHWIDGEDVHILLLRKLTTAVLRFGQKNGKKNDFVFRFSNKRNKSDLKFMQLCFSRYQFILGPLEASFQSTPPIAQSFQSSLSVSQTACPSSPHQIVSLEPQSSALGSAVPLLAMFSIMSLRSGSAKVIG